MLDIARSVIHQLLLCPNLQLYFMVIICLKCMTDVIHAAKYETNTVFNSMNSDVLKTVKFSHFIAIGVVILHVFGTQYNMLFQKLMCLMLELSKRIMLEVAKLGAEIRQMRNLLERQCTGLQYSSNDIIPQLSSARSTT